VEAAVALAEEANELTGGTQPFMLDTLAMAYAETGRFHDAMAMIEKAIALAGTAGDQGTLAAMRERLRLYESGRPYRETSTNAPPAMQRGFLSPTPAGTSPGAN
jgi:hypothetical protein